MNEARKLAAERFARAVSSDPDLNDGFAALIEALEFACFERWRVTAAGEGWRVSAGELAALRQLRQRVKLIGGDDGGANGSK